MPYKQRDIVRVKVKLSDGLGSGGTVEITHPVLIISCEAANSFEKDRWYNGVMMTHSEFKGRFSKPITKEMVDGNLGDKPSFIKLHILVRFTEKDISRDAQHYLGKMKLPDFKGVLQEIYDYVLCADT